MYNRNNIYIKLIFILTLVIIAGCYKDKGNYSYVNIDDVTIDTSGIPVLYSLQRFDTLSISPVVKYKGEVVNPVKSQFPKLKFLWTLYPAAGQNINDEHILDSTLRLHKMLDQPELTWELLFTVINTKTSVKAFAKFSVAIAPSLAEGWMVLYEKEGATDVGMIVNDRISRASVKERILYDLYAASNGAHIKGKPGSLITTTASFPNLNIYIQTTEDALSIVPGTFKRKAGFSDSLFWTVPAAKSPSYVSATEGRREFLLNNNRLYKIDYSVIASGRRSFDDGAGGTYGKLAPWIATSTHGSMAAIAYDQTEQRFLKMGLSDVDLMPFATKQSASAPFDINNTGMEFLFSELGRNYYEHAVMKEKSTGKYYLLVANFRTPDTATSVGKGKYEMTNCPEISTINTIAAGYLGEIFYYGAGSNKLYQFKYTPGVTETLWSAPANEKITCITLQKYYSTNPALASRYDPKNANKVLYVATYDEAAGTGKVYEMLVDPSSGAITAGSECMYTGFGKIKAMAWKLFI